MKFYVISYYDGRTRSGHFWTDGAAEQFAKDYSLGYPFTIEEYDCFDDYLNS